jgi:hypothetical protein
MKPIFCAALAAVTLAVNSASATVVWDLNPQKLNQAAGSTSEAYNSQGYTITAYGFNLNGNVSSPQELFFKHEGPINGAFETGLGVSNTHDQELQVNNNGSPFDFIQFDLSAILSAGASSGALSVDSLQSGESFSIYASNALGTLGTQVGGVYGSSFDDKFVDLPNFGAYKYYSIVAASGDALPAAIRADFGVVPEMNALLPIVMLLGAVGIAERIRRRRTA